MGAGRALASDHGQLPGGKQGRHVHVPAAREGREGRRRSRWRSPSGRASPAGLSTVMQPACAGGLFGGPTARSRALVRGWKQVPPQCGTCMVCAALLRSASLAHHARAGPDGQGVPPTPAAVYLAGSVTMAPNSALGCSAHPRLAGRGGGTLAQGELREGSGHPGLRRPNAVRRRGIQSRARCAATDINLLVASWYEQ